MDGGAPYYSSRQINPPAKLGGKGAENRIWEYSCGKCARADFPDGAVGKLLRAHISRARADFPDGAVGKILRAQIFPRARTFPDGAVGKVCARRFSRVRADFPTAPSGKISQRQPREIHYCRGLGKARQQEVRNPLLQGCIHMGLLAEATRVQG